MNLVQGTKYKTLLFLANKNRLFSYKIYKNIQVEFLVGGGGSSLTVVVLGMLTQLTEGQMHLEDDTGAVRLDCTGANFHSGEI